MFSEQTAYHSAEISTPGFSKVKKRVRNKVPSSGTHAIDALERKYRETLGQIKQLDEALYEWDGRSGFDLANKYEIELRARLRASLVSLENSIRLLDPKWNRKHLLVPKIKHQTSPMFERTIFQTALVALLCRAAEPLTIFQIVAKLAPGLGLPNPSADQRRRLRAMADGTLRRYYVKGFVDCDEAKPARWFARKSQAEGGMGTR